MQVVDLTRKFKYNSVNLADPNPALSPEQVKEFFAAHYPELNNAVVEGPVTKDGVATYSFLRAAGAKGAVAAAYKAKDLIQRTLSPLAGAVGAEQALVAAASDPRFAAPASLLAGVVKRHEKAAPLHMPSGVFGIFG